MPIQYRPLLDYKYQVETDYTQLIRIRPDAVIVTPFICLTCDGTLLVKRNYAWDGPSGPTIDTPNFMRGSLVHDALYQLMRLKHLDYKLHRRAADDELHDVCREDGMSSIRAWNMRNGVRLFGESHARPPEPPVPAAVWAP